MEDLQNWDKPKLLPKQEIIARKRAEIDKIGDQEGKGIDEGIKDAVVALNLLGYRTDNSCEGHTYGGRNAPFVDMELEGEPKSEDRRVEEENALKIIANKNNTSARAIEENIYEQTIDGPYFLEWSQAVYSEEYQKWMQESIKAINALRLLLEEFYQKRKVDSDVKLILDVKFSRFTLHNGGENYNSNPTENKSTPQQIEQISQRLPLYQKEMKEFADFLINKFIKK